MFGVNCSVIIYSWRYDVSITANVTSDWMGPDVNTKTDCVYSPDKNGVKRESGEQRLPLNATNSFKY